MTTPCDKARSLLRREFETINQKLEHQRASVAGEKGVEAGFSISRYHSSLKEILETARTLNELEGVLDTQGKEGQSQ